jgi:hypothetical protein
MLLVLPARTLCAYIDAPALGRMHMLYYSVFTAEMPSCVPPYLARKQVILLLISIQSKMSALPPEPSHNSFSSIK